MESDRLDTKHEFPAFPPSPPNSPIPYMSSTTPIWRISDGTVKVQMQFLHNLLLPGDAKDIASYQSN